VEPFIAQVILFGGTFTIRNFAACEGQPLPIAQNTALFSLIGTLYGGDGRTTFALPDLRGRSVFGMGNAPNLTPRNVGQQAGVETTTLNAQQIAAHAHNLSGTIQVVASSGAATSNSPENNFLAAAGLGTNIYSNAGTPPVTLNNGTIDSNLEVTSTGNSQPIDNMPPFLVMNYQIALVGIFPPRN